MGLKERMTLEAKNTLVVSIYNTGKGDYNNPESKLITKASVTLSITRKHLENTGSKNTSTVKSGKNKENKAKKKKDKGGKSNTKTVHKPEESKVLKGNLAIRPGGHYISGDFFNLMISSHIMFAPPK